MSIVSALALMVQSGDGVLPAAEPDCSPLRVESADFGTLSQQKRHVIRIIKGGDGELYVSLPPQSPRADWGLPLTVRYAPAQASVSSMRVALIVDGAVKSMSEPQTVAGANGTIDVPDLIMPVFSGAEETDRVGFAAIVEGTVCGRKQTSKSDAPNIGVEGKTAFTPLFSAEERLPPVRRYGARDAGGDGWATRAALDWLRARPYRFDDITGLHAPQTPTGRSALGHSGHSNGRQIDLRYADGSGGYNDTLGGGAGGKHILRLITEAQAEVKVLDEGKAQGGDPITVKSATVAADKSGDKPTEEKVKGSGALTRLGAWVRANRSMIESELPGAEKVYIGNVWLAAMLRDGLFPDNTPAPGIGPWELSTADRQKVRPVPGHLHHWHINLKR